MSIVKKLLFLVIVISLSASAIQKKTGFIRVKPLNGVFDVKSKPEWSKKAFLAGFYQEQLRMSLEDSVGFKPDLVRLYNQIEYSLFSIPHAAKIVVGKDGYLFAETYIKAYTGADFVGKYFIDQKIKDLKWLQEYLRNEKGILLIVVLAPGKGFYYPEYIPGKWLKNKREMTNYSCYSTGCRENGINCIDFNRWLLNMKDTARYPLYPKTGIHWSSYAAYQCADSLQKYIAVKLNRPVPRMITDSVRVRADAWYDDADQGQTLNLFREIPHPAYAYPFFHFQWDSAHAKPSCLFVGDSFYWYWFNSKIIENTFSNKAFWYYNNEVYPEQKTKPTNTGELDYVQEILKNNVIVLIQTNGGYGHLGYGWLDLAFDYLYPGETRSKVIERQMKADASWMKSLENKAKERNIKTEQMMRLDATYMMNQEILTSKQNKASLHRPE